MFSKLRYQFGILAGFLIVSVVLVINYVQREVLNTYADPMEIPPVIPLAKRRSTVDRSAYVFLGLGPQAFQRNCPAAIESLVKHAGWDGDVYLISDKPRCFNKTDIIHNTGIKASKMHFAFVNDGGFGAGGVSTENMQIALRKGRLLAKGMKTKIFDYVSKDIDQVAFADCDMLFGIEGCAADFINSGPPFGPDVHLKVRKVGRDESTGSLNAIHTGVFVAHRNYSRETLQLWGEEVNSLQYDMDFKAYLGAYKKVVDKLIADKTLHPAAVHNNMLNPMEPTQVQIGYPWERFVNLTLPSNEQIACMNHISKQRCIDYGRDKIQAFVHRFRLKNYQDGQQYCVHPWVKPFLYGWFPLNWLTTCPKFETIL